MELQEHLADYEVWVPVEGCPDYDISNMGRLYSRRSSQGLLKPGRYTSKDLPRIVQLHNDNGYVVTPLHILVAYHFIPSYVKGAQVIHVDGDKSNNAAGNLVCLTRGLPRDEYDVTTMRKYRPVRIVETGEIFPSVGLLADQIDGDRSTIYKCLRGEIKRHLGYTYEWVEK